MKAAAPRTALLAGASGLVGRALLAGLLADAAVVWVHALVRRPLGVEHPKLTAHIVDYARLPALPPVLEVYLALGTTIKAAGSQAAFRAVDYEANLAVARAAQAAGAQRLGLVSAMGASVRSAVFYNRVKADLEDALQGLAYAGLVIARPALLLGDRRALGQPARPLETLMEGAGVALRPLLPRHYRPIAAADVARALLERVPHARGVEWVLSGEMQPKR
jgi:uncharacterized protein YbjT (DUF2867 family)